VVLLEAPENAQSHVTYLAFELPFNFIIFQATAIFEFARNSQKTECNLYLSYDASVCFRPHKGLAAVMEGLEIEVGNKEFFL
jgi:hypothetical protein